MPDADTIAYNKLLTELRTALPEGKTLSAALPCSQYYGKYFTPEVLVKNLDWLGFMTYDITGDWDEKAMFDSPLYPHEGYTTWSWEQTHDYIEGTGNPILDSIAVVLRDGSTDAIPYASKVKATPQHRQQNVTGKQVDALGKYQQGKQVNSKKASYRVPSRNQ